MIEKYFIAPALVGEELEKHMEELNNGTTWQSYKGEYAAQISTLVQDGVRKGKIILRESPSFWPAMPEGMDMTGYEINNHCLVSWDEARKYLSEQTACGFPIIPPWGEPKAEAVGNSGKGNQAATEPASANEFEFSELLHKPSHKDDWFEVIDDMTKAFYREHNEMPTEAQAWTQLCQNPPHCYGIRPDDDETSLTMPGAGRPLTKRSFRRRWVKYTAKLSPFKPN